MRLVLRAPSDADPVESERAEGEATPATMIRWMSKAWPVDDPVDRQEFEVLRKLLRIHRDSQERYRWTCVRNMETDIWRFRVFLPWTNEPDECFPYFMRTTTNLWNVIDD